METETQQQQQSIALDNQQPNEPQQDQQLIMADMVEAIAVQPTTDADISNIVQQNIQTLDTFQQQTEQVAQQFEVAIAETQSQETQESAHDSRELPQDQQKQQQETNVEQLDEVIEHPDEEQILENVAQVPLAQEEQVDEVEIQRRKLEVVPWLQEWLNNEGITLINVDLDNLEPVLELNLYSHLRSGVLLCKVLNQIMLANPSFTQNNLPPIEINERSDLFASMCNLSNFVRTAELYFNIDRFRMFEPINVLKNSNDERPFINALFFLKIVLEETSLSFPVQSAKPYAALTFEQLSTLIAMITTKPSAPTIAYDPRVVLSVQDIELFQRLVGRVDIMESSNKNMSVLVTTMTAKFDKIEREQQEIQHKLDGLLDGVLGAFEDISTKIRDLQKFTDIVGNSALGLANAIQNLDNKSLDMSMFKKLEDSRHLSESTVAKLQVSIPDESLNKQNASSAPVSAHSPSPLTSSQTASPTNTNNNATLSRPSQTLNQQSSAPKIFKLPDEVLSKGLPKEEIMRQSVLYEVIDSEADYVRDIVTMLEGHRKSLREQRILDENQIKTMFSNLDELLPVNQDLLTLLVNRRDQNPVIEGIGDLFLQVIDKFMVYDMYCAYYPQALQLYKELKNREDMKLYLERSINDPQYRGLSLESFLIKPVQRICKYPLLLRELIKNTPKDHKDKPILEQCMAKIEEVVTLVNERTRAVGDREKVLELQARIEATPPLDLANSPRRILKEGPIQKIIGGKNKDRYLVILSDMLLICKQNQGKGKLQFEQAVDLRSSALNQLVNPKQAGGSMGIKTAKTMFEITIPGESLVFVTANEQDRSRWISTLEDALKHVNDAPKKFAEIPSQKGNVSRPVSAQAPIDIFKQQNSSNSFTTSSGGTLKKSNTLMKKKSNLWSRKKQGGSHDNITDDTVNEGSEDSQAHQQPSQQAQLQQKQSLVEDNSQQEEHLKSRRGSGSSAKSSSSSRQNQPRTAEVHGFPLWRAVDAGNGAVYYFNTETQETSWYHPAVTTQTQFDMSTLTPEEIQKLYQQKIEYMQRLQEQANALASSANAAATNSTASQANP